MSPRSIRRRSLWAAGLAVTLFTAVGCGSTAESGSSPATPAAPAASAASSGPGSSAASGSSTDPAASSPAAAMFPVTIEHAFGSTEITEAPARVVTWGWGTPDAVLALGVVPVAMEKLTYGADADGFMPWFTEAMAENGGEMPTTLTPGESPPFEEILEADPDVILAPYSGITEADYQKLAAIAPTVAYPGEAWNTPWRDVITTVGTVLGRSAEAKELLAGIDETVAAAAAEHPEFEGTTIAAVAADPSTFYVYSGADPRVQYLEDLGFTIAPSVAELDTKETTFYYTLSLENVDKLTSDVLLSYSETPERAAEVAAEPALQKMGQFTAGTVASVVGAPLISSVSPPTALSLTWGLDDFVAALAAATKKVG